MTHAAAQNSRCERGSLGWVCHGSKWPSLHVYLLLPEMASISPMHRHSLVNTSECRRSCIGLDGVNPSAGPPSAPVWAPTTDLDAGSDRLSCSNQKPGLSSPCLHREGLPAFQPSAGSSRDPIQTGRSCERNPVTRNGRHPATEAFRIGELLD